MKANIFLFSKHSRYLTVLNVILTEVERSQRKSGSSHWQYSREIWGLPGKYPAIWNISRTGRVALM